MSNELIQQIPKLRNLPKGLLNDTAVRLELEQGVVIFRASETLKVKIENLLEKYKTDSLTSEEKQEFEAYGEIDDYLSHVNRLIRNSFEHSEVNLAA